MKLKVGDFLIRKTNEGIEIAVVAEYWSEDQSYDISIIGSDYRNKSRAYTYKTENQFIQTWDLEEQGWEKLEV